MLEKYKDLQNFEEKCDQALKAWTEIHALLQKSVTEMVNGSNDFILLARYVGLQHSMEAIAKPIRKQLNDYKDI